MAEKLIFTKRKIQKSKNGLKSINVYDADYETIRRIASETGLTKSKLISKILQFAVENMEIKEDIA